ncbi:MAG: rhamnulokinase, partial [Acidimicrobiales bacterium]
MTESVVSVDLGASSGRVFIVAVEGDRIRLEAVSRFGNGGIWLQGQLFWNILALYGSLVEGLAAAQRQELERGHRSVSVGIDAWAVDYGLLDRNGRLKGFPFHHRDPRTASIAASTLERVGEWELYRRTGVTAHSFNTIFQLQDDLSQGRVDDGDRVLLIPDLLAYFLTNEMRWETTNASTTDLMGLDGSWDDGIFSEMALPRSLVGDLSVAGARVGTIRAAEALNFGVVASTPVTSVASHDTASAVVAVPASTEHFAYISSGTWSLIGVELRSPVISQEGMRAGFTNELGIDGTVRYLRNVMGFWLLQQVLAELAMGSSPLAVSELS